MVQFNKKEKPVLLKLLEFFSGCWWKWDRSIEYFLQKYKPSCTRFLALFFLFSGSSAAMATKIVEIYDISDADDIWIPNPADKDF